MNHARGAQQVRPTSVSDPEAELIPCSVNMLTRNSSVLLDRSLGSVSEFAEIIIADGGSTDTTREIARQHGCRILDQDPSNQNADGTLHNFAAAREQVLGESRQSWVLYLDSDEVVSPEMAEKIRAICADGASADVYEFRLKHIIDGREVDCASTYPMYLPRLFRRSAVRGFASVIDERIDADSEPVRCSETLLHVLPELRRVTWRWLRYLRVDVKELRAATPDFRRSRRRQRRSEVRWFFRDYRRSRRDCVGHRMPRRYEYARLGFYLARYGLTLTVRSR